MMNISYAYPMTRPIKIWQNSLLHSLVCNNDKLRTRSMNGLFYKYDKCMHGAIVFKQTIDGMVTFNKTNESNIKFETN